MITSLLKRVFPRTALFFVPDKLFVHGDLDVASDATIGKRQILLLRYGFIWAENIA